MPQTLTEKLQLLIDCIDKGAEVQWRYANAADEEKWQRYVYYVEEISLRHDRDYRAKPAWPRTGMVFVPAGEDYLAVEFTEEVKQAMADAGMKIQP